MKRDLRDAWIGADPIGWGGRWQGWEQDTSRTYRVALSILERVRPAIERPRLAVRAWRGGSTDVGGWRLIQLRAKASLLALVGPIRWHYPSYPVRSWQVTSWDFSSSNGGEQTIYDWTDMHVGAGRNLRLYVCRDTAP